MLRRWDVAGTVEWAKFSYAYYKFKQAFDDESTAARVPVVDLSCEIADDCVEIEVLRAVDLLRSGSKIPRNSHDVTILQFTDEQHVRPHEHANRPTTIN